MEHRAEPRTEESLLLTPPPHFRDGETGAWAGYLNFPRTHNWVVAKKLGILNLF